MNLLISQIIIFTIFNLLIDLIFSLIFKDREEEVL